MSLNKSALASYLGACSCILWLFPSQCFAANDSWVEVRSPNFTIYTDVGEKRGRDVAVRFEQARAVFGRLLNQDALKTRVPVQVVAFRSSREMHEVVPLWRGRPVEVVGLFVPGADRDHIVLDMSADRPWQIVFHEFAQEMLRTNLRMRADPWFQQGFGGYFEGVEVDGKDARVGNMPMDMRHMLNQLRLMEVTTLFQIGRNSGVYNDAGGTHAAFYLQSTLVMHYIYDNKLSPNVAKYFELTQQGMSVNDAIQKAFGMTAQEFDSRLSVYQKVGRFAVTRFPSPTGAIDSTTFAVTPVSDSGVAGIREGVRAAVAMVSNPMPVIMRRIQTVMESRTEKPAERPVEASASPVPDEWKETKESEIPEPPAPIETAVTPTPQAVNTPVKFLKGTLSSVDCSAKPVAVLTVNEGAKVWKMNVADTEHMILMGADKFSCSWTKQKVAVNYRMTGDGEGNVVSLEVQ